MQATWDTSSALCATGITCSDRAEPFPVQLNKAVSVGIVCFNWAVWTERTSFLLALGYLPGVQYLVNRILLRAQARIPADKQNCAGPAEGLVAEFARHPPADASVAYTD